MYPKINSSFIRACQIFLLLFILILQILYLPFPTDFGPQDLYDIYE